MVIEIILLLILIVFVLSGYRKGLVLSLCSLLILLVACLGASIAQDTLTDRVVEQLHPQLSESISEQLEGQVSTSVGDALDNVGDAGLSIGGKSVTVDDIIDLLAKFGIDVKQSTQDAAGDLTAPVVASAADAISLAILNAVVGFLIFVAAFLVIYLVLRVVELGINTVDRLPVVHTLNHLSGALVGLISGAFVLVTFMTILSRTGLLSEDTFSGPVSGLLIRLVDAVM